MKSTDKCSQNFTFAIITDTHIRPPQGDDSSPYQVNDLANERARYASSLLAGQDPEFTIHLGDMVHTLPHLPTYDDACSEAHSIFQPLKPNLHFVAGNHDIGDKPMTASPAGQVDDDSSEKYQQNFGSSWYGFEHGNCGFIIMNSSLVNTDCAAEVRQKAWLENRLETWRKKRVFLFSHYPPFIHRPDEPAHYDNYEEPGRSWLLGLVAQNNIEAVFSGHVHQFFFNRTGETKLYCLPPTSFTRQDYSELYKSGPQREFGRDDHGKFSVALVHVSAQGHQLDVIPTFGRGTPDGGRISVEKSEGTTTKPFIVHMRHAWYEAIDLPYNGPMEEFSRKRARNDYSLVRLWQMGIWLVRTPLSDLVDPLIRERVLDWAAAGIKFRFVTSKQPEQICWNLIANHSDLVDSLEFASRIDCIDDMLSQLAEMDQVEKPKIALTKIHTSADEPQSGTQYAHNVSAGFLPQEADVLVQHLPRNLRVNELVYQINLEDDLAEVCNALTKSHAKLDTNPVFNIRFADRNPARANFNDDLIESRVAEAMKFNLSNKTALFQLDTFADIDRGYSPRNGLVDRSFNLRPAGKLLAAQ